ncbi:exported hypothetical protein [Rhodospirillaceae bacterium LM-1]|nr:exported hypothetical protein [Rhodospirillaceae bacterium LM-1]
MRVVFTALTLSLLLAGCSVTSDRETVDGESLGSDNPCKIAPPAPDRAVDYSDMKRI